ncbi:TlpA family protein disulfide reductase [Tenacibaculum sp. ZS6-P6]|uniref:TlpA family protein disulfide reductase n=1 Tax=Tenacibaculum sp. ZS6-P6 TaxID=3447503 RepID=UPI003F9C5C78
MKLLSLLFILMVFLSCKPRIESSFSEKALQDQLVTLSNDSITFKNVLNQYKGKKILIDVWASWCSDCIKSMPKVSQLQKDNPDIVFLFLSIDDSLTDLQNGISKYGINGEHYLLPSSWDGDLGEFLDLSWIPRYLIINEVGGIEVFNAIRVNDSRVLNALK